MSRKFLKTRCTAISHIQQISLFSQRLVQNLVQNLSQANRVFSIEEHEPFTERSVYMRSAMRSVKAFRSFKLDMCLDSNG